MPSTASNICCYLVIQEKACPWPSLFLEICSTVRLCINNYPLYWGEFRRGRFASPHLYSPSSLPFSSASQGIHGRAPSWNESLHCQLLWSLTSLSSSRGSGCDRRGCDRRTCPSCGSWRFAHNRWWGSFLFWGWPRLKGPEGSCCFTADRGGKCSSCGNFHSPDLQVLLLPGKDWGADFYLCLG